MKKSLAIVAVLALGFSLFAPMQDAEARSRYNRASFKERVCNFVERAEIRAWKNFDQDKKWKIRQVQNRINFQDRINCEPTGSVVDQLLERSQFSTLAFALGEAGLVSALDEGSDLTVFAPTNQAFEKLGDALNDVVADKDLLTDVLLYHVVNAGVLPGGPFSVPSEIAVTLDSAPMLNGDDVSVNFENGKLFINDSQVIVTDLQAENGIVHVIDTVLLPPSS